MKCPRCSSGMSTENYEGVEIDRCSDCNGVWLDRGEITQIINTEEETFSEELINETIDEATKGIPKDEQENDLFCPKCSNAMRPTNYNYSSGIIIDSCPKGHGVWLDNSELEKVQANGEHWANQAKKHSAEWGALSKKAYDGEKKRWKKSHRDDISKSIMSRLIRKFI